ncbi:MAG: hypothetical protein JXB13_15440, partial [Phycisphaerae bacterium]|nr:hypothetical protein [Phycisphaerae bacterium]
NFEGTAFTGTFDGDGHVIRNLTIYTEEGDFLGLFGHLSGSGSAISRLGVEGVSIVGGDDGWAVGGLCARLDNGIIRECYARVALTPGSRTWHAGGLCGVIDDGASIEDCFVDGTLSGGTPAYYTGGLCGCNSYGSIRRSYACVEMTLGSGSAAVGGFCGDNWYGTIQSCFWDTTVSGMSSSDGGTGKTTTQMLQQSTFTSVGWDFDTTWQMADYPALACFPPATGYDAWAESRGIPIDQRAFDAAPAGDGVANLLKYASGLPPMQSCETADLMQPQPAAGEALFRVRYFVSSTATDVLLQPVACASLSGPWLTDSVLTTLVSESDGRQTWEATVLLGDSCGFVRLRATGTDGLSDTDSLFGRCGYAPSATGTEGRFHGGGGSRSGVEASR